VNTLLFTLREGILNLRRAPILSATSVAVMGLSLFVLGIFLLITVNLRTAITAVQKQVEVVVFLQPEFRDAELQSLRSSCSCSPSFGTRSCNRSMRFFGSIPPYCRRAF
jgi:cell division transport system permease protein